MLEVSLQWWPTRRVFEILQESYHFKTSQGYGITFLTGQDYGYEGFQGVERIRNKKGRSSKLGILTLCSFSYGGILLNRLTFSITSGLIDPLLY